MGSRGYRQQISCQIEAVLGTYGRNGGETSMHFFSRKMTQVEILASSLFRQHLAQDGASYHVTWGKLGLGRVAQHETLTAMIAQIGTFATYGLRDQVGSIACHK